MITLLKGAFSIVAERHVKHWPEYKWEIRTFFYEIWFALTTHRYRRCVGRRGALSCVIIFLPELTDTFHIIFSYVYNLYSLEIDSPNLVQFFPVNMFNIVRRSIKRAHSLDKRNHFRFIRASKWTKVNGGKNADNSIIAAAFPDLIWSHSIYKPLNILENSLVEYVCDRYWMKNNTFFMFAR